MPAPTDDVHSWAEATFGMARLGDARRTKRVVATAAAMAAKPSQSLPKQLSNPAALKGSYRVLDEEAVSFEGLMEPHFEQSREAAGSVPLALLVQDTTELDYTFHPAASSLGPIGDGRGRGYLLHGVLGVVPASREILGLLHQEPFLRKPAPKGEKHTERLKRERESQVWERAVGAVGPPPDGCTWVHVGDRYSDLFDFLAACGDEGCHFLVRAWQNRRIRAADETSDYLMDHVRSLPPQGRREIELPRRHGHRARTATLEIAAAPVQVLSPQRTPKRAPLTAWVLRVWEVNPPAEITEPVEWVLVTSVPTQTVEEQWERVAWYTCRWLIEEYHSCLKTGCGIEARQLETKDRLWRLLGLCSPMAVRILQLRQAARAEPDRPAREVLAADVIAVVALLGQVNPASMTVDQAMREIARQGGYLGRKRDGPPGWKALWHGWQHVQTLVEGVRLARLIAP
jgi:transposase-like protein/transposase Tn5 family protein